MLYINPYDLFGLSPWLCAAVFGILSLVFGVFGEGENRRYIGWLSIAGLLATAVFAWVLWSKEATPAGQYIFNRMLIVDDFALFFIFLFSLVGIFTILQSFGYIEEQGINYGEFYPLIMFSLVGMMIMSGATDLLTLFIGIETASIPIYVMVAMVRRRSESGEGALKYFVLGAFASAFLLYGMAFLYGATGKTNLKEIYYILYKLGGINGEPMAMLGLVLILVGIGFKLALVPFHMWTPDAYEGAPTFITSFMATGVKAAGFAALLRVLVVVFPKAVMVDAAVGWTTILAALAALTMFVGNLIALVQKDIKRMLAYSSIAHAGYALVGVCSITGDKAQNIAVNSAVMYYLLAYTLMTAGAFGVVMLLERRDEKSSLSFENYRGLAYEKPWLAMAMAVFMFSLAGIPPFMGFFGKFFVFKAAVDAGLVWLAVVGVVNSLISVYYYLYVTIMMYMHPAETQVRTLHSPAIAATVIISAALLIYLGIFSDDIISLAQKGANAMMRLAG
ncbi:MAG: NADH-quinone oxidoreductase subunit N [Myxococcota bacterium]